MSNQLTLFHFDEGRTSFEDLSHENGQTYWLESDLRPAMGYCEGGGFRKAIMRAMQACLSVGIMTDDNFVRSGDEYKLTRFACYLVAMNGDSKKPEVASAQVYFAALAATYTTHLEHADGIDRLVIRDEVKTGEKSLSATVSQRGVSGGQFGIFKDAGYRGMYNMSLRQLKQHKGLKDNAVVADHMGKAEMAAHLFRITQTEARIQSTNVSGLNQLNSVAKTVGSQVRNLVQENTGKSPENLPCAEPINKVRTKIKGTSKNLKKIDQPKT